MLPPRLVRRCVLAPLAIIVAVAVAVLYPLLAAGSRLLRLAGLAPPGYRRVLRLLLLALVWLTGKPRRCSPAWDCGSPPGSAAGSEPNRSRAVTTRSCAGS